MFLVGLFYLIISSPLFLKKMLKLRLNYISMKIYEWLFIVGISNLFLSLINIFYKSYIWTIFGCIAVIVMAFIVLKATRDYMQAIEVMDKFDEDKRNGD